MNEEKGKGVKEKQKNNYGRMTVLNEWIFLKDIWMNEEKGKRVKEKNNNYGRKTVEWIKRAERE